MSRSYQLFGTVLMLFGSAIALVAFFVADSPGLIAIGISNTVLGMISILIGSTRDHISDKLGGILLATEVENTNNLLKALGITNKAIYFPRSARSERSQAVLFLKIEKESGKDDEDNLNGLITKIDKTKALELVTPGNKFVELFMNDSDVRSNDVESFLINVLVTVLDVANSVELSQEDKIITVVVRGAQLRAQPSLYEQCLGSPIASIVAATLCEMLNKPMRVVEEIEADKESKITLQALDERSVFSSLNGS